MKIAIATYTLSYGGIGNIVIDLAQFLKNNSCEVEIICTDSPGKWYYKIREIGVKSKKFNVGILGWLPLGRIIHSVRVGKYIRKQNFDFIINNHSYYVHASGKYYRPKTKLITVINNQLPQMIDAECRSNPDIVVCVSNEIYKHAIKYQKDNKIITILNGAKFEANYNKEFSESTKGLKILFVGRIEDRQKAVFVFPEILSVLKEHGINVHLTIVGAGPDEIKLKKLFEKADLNQMVSFAGLVDSDKVFEYYRANDILLLPSNFEGLPLTLIEAMGNGCVPIVSNLPDITDLCVKNGINGYLVHPGDAKGFAEKIENLNNNRELLKRMSQDSIKIANTEFSLDNVHLKYLDLINSISNTKDEKRIIRDYYFPFVIWKEFFPIKLIMLFKKLQKKIRS